ncbi:hypothetical protein SAMN02910298_02594 [Pseudobutyrivibrio sp. YE44]|uniref:hypothetical protein n=1 Tax=Pseudobutyrivibrio sp. YE44 TaxID=1520802 RepID=UPI000880AD6A|nr:hypothetical protein [Pseudobutyrivibrio sp. YE44]SDB50881.1 hypothetical protein SAMN02910298_02594 [Pseudobutyrivibrio sp. YE44]
MMNEKNKIPSNIDIYDAKVLDFSCHFFGDEVNVYIEISEQEICKLSFIMCTFVKYETDASWGRSDSFKYVKDMNLRQLGYFCERLWVEPSNDDIELFWHTKELRTSQVSK